MFPKITRASVGVGVQRGTGTLFKDGNPEGFYTTTGTSVGLQAGAKTYGYALFFMNDNAVQALSKAKGFEVGVGPTVVVVNKGTSKNLTTTTLKSRHLCGHFRPEGPDSRPRRSREQDHEGEPQVGAP